MENPRSAVQAKVNTPVSCNSKNGTQQFRICLTRAHRGVKRFSWHSPPINTLGSSWLSPSHPSCHVASKYIFTQLSESFKMLLCLPKLCQHLLLLLWVCFAPPQSRRSCQTEGCASPAPPWHSQGTAVSSETTAGTSCTWGQVWHKDLLRKLWDSLWCCL